MWARYTRVLIGFLKLTQIKSVTFPYTLLTQLWPDIAIYSNMAKKVILIELTCPCEEYDE